MKHGVRIHRVFRRRHSLRGAGEAALFLSSDQFLNKHFLKVLILDHAQTQCLLYFFQLLLYHQLNEFHRQVVKVETFHKMLLV